MAAEPVTVEDRVDDMERRLRQKLESVRRARRVIEFSEFRAALVHLNFVGVQSDVRCLFDRYDQDGSGLISYSEFSGAVFGLVPCVANDPKSRSAVERVRAKIASRGGLNGIRTLGRILRTMDDNGNGQLDRYELEWGLRDYGLDMSEGDIDTIMKAFDRDRSGQVSFDELLRGIRGKLNKRRRDIILQAFDVLDKDGSGEVTIEDVASVYDTSKHPEVKEGAKTPAEVLTEFMKQWDTVEKDGIITKEEFLDYYKDVSASIDTDDYFELVLRNAWHIPGGEGAAANTANKCVLVTHYDGSQEIVQIKNDLGLDLKDMRAVRARLREQGVKSVADVKL